MYKHNTHIHLMGIAGIGMSAIAHVLCKQGYIVSGCDSDTEKKTAQELSKIGCKIYKNHNADHWQEKRPDIIVYSTAIAQDAEELNIARKLHIPVIGRAEMLAELMRPTHSIAVAGAHGKTTTASLIAHILIEAHFDPTVIIGGHLINMQANARSGNGIFSVVEADESDRSFLQLRPTFAVITNINLEHPDRYKDLADVRNAYAQFLTGLPFYGKAFLCIDDLTARSLLPLQHTVTYGLCAEADIHARDIELRVEESSFLCTAKGQMPERILLPLPGEHNVLNSLGAIAIALEVGIPLASIKNALSSFKGVERRFWFRGTLSGAELFDDYAVHPKEIAAIIKVARKRAQKKLIVVWEPHRYTRTFHLKDAFIKTFCSSTVDELIITDIYAASENPIDGISGSNFAQAIADCAHAKQMDISYQPFDYDFNGLKERLYRTAEPGDLILLLGAGKLTNLPEHLT